MIRQYRIVSKTPDTDPVTLQPIVHAALYNIPEVRAAIVFAQTNLTAELIGMRINARFYSVVVVYAEELLENHFEFSSE